MRFALLVGIAGGAPSHKQDIRLGDVVLGTKVVPYATGKETDHGFERTGMIRAPPRELLEMITFLEERVWSEDVLLSDSIEKIRTKIARDGNAFLRPTHDRLYKNEFIHRESLCDCLRPVSQQRAYLYPRNDRAGDLVQLFQGAIGSDNQVIKNAQFRDDTARREKILCYEMEATGVMDVTPCLPIRGISDYSDGHKNDEWHLYAALAAATCARELLLSVPPHTVAQFPLTLAGDFVDRYLTGATSNPNAFSGSEIEKLRQARNSLMERHGLLQELMLSALRKMDGGSRDEIGAAREEVQRLKTMQAALKRHLQDLDRILKQHNDLLSSQDPTVREQYMVLKSQVQRDTEAMESLSEIAQDSLQTTSKMLKDLAKSCNNKALDIAGIVLGASGELRADLKAYQLEGLSFLLYLHENGIGGILGDEMGLGKTLQTLALFQSLKEADLPEDFHAPFLVVCPLSVLETWVSETVKWTPDLAVLKYHGSPAERSEMKKKLGAQKRKGYAGGLPDIVVTSYETILSDMAWFSRTFVWRYVVLDEGHRIKNFKAKRTLGLSKIQAEYKLVLTGTPIQNNLEELWSILHWLYPEVFVESSVTMFADAFSLSNGVFDRIFFEDITEFLKLIMLRREKGSPELGLSIPGKMEFIISVPLCDLQRTWYLRVLGIWSEINDFHGLPGSSVNGSEGASRRIKISQNILMELRKVCIHPYLLDSAMPCPYKVGVDLVMQSGKFQVLLRLVQRFVTEQKKVIIFSGFEGALDLCEDMLSMLQTSTATFRYARLDGHTSRAARNLATYLFQHDGRYLIFLISIRAGGEGLNLTSSSTVIFLDEDWNPQVMKQACSRVHRIGQTKPVEVFRIQARGTIEEQMARRLEKKAYMAERVTENVRAHKSLPGRTRMALPDMMCSPNAVGPEASMSYLPDDDDGLDAGLGACIIKRVNDQSVSGTLTAEEEEAWLERAERVRTDVLDGRRVGTRPKSVSTFDQQARVELRREDRRIGKERTVLIGGFQVSKESIAVCEALPSPKSPSAVSKGTKSGRITHESTAQYSALRHLSEVISLAMSRDPRQRDSSGLRTNVSPSLLL
ncbi:SNF2 family N-terminal domain-containing protein [Aspergillus ambiguus]|uniref:putative nucleosome remodeling complex ATPase subunit (Snf2h) n=1 Tax=Aspergillus ambiguus TaxID=176160 RepID=UPI003CCCF7B5